MKQALALLLLCLVSIVLYASEGTPPAREPANPVPRFVVVSGAIPTGTDHTPRPAFIRLDTFTGEAWVIETGFVRFGPNTTEAATFPQWTPIHEPDSELVKMARDSARK